MARFEVARTPVGLVNVFSASTTYSLQWLDAGLLDRMVFYVQSTADQAVRAQVVGSDFDASNQLNAAVNVGEAANVPAGSASQGFASIGVKLDQGDWHPWLGLTIVTTATPPTDGGVISAWATYRRILVEE